MTDLVSLLKDAMADDMAPKWKDYIMRAHVKPLAPATVASKIAKGASYPDIPLVDTELMINSIESGAAGDDSEAIGYVTISDPARAEIAVIHEYGLGPPARPTLRPVWDANIDHVLDKIFDNVFKQIQEEF